MSEEQPRWKLENMYYPHLHTSDNTPDVFICRERELLAIMKATISLKSRKPMKPSELADGWEQN